MIQRLQGMRSAAILLHLLLLLPCRRRSASRGCGAAALGAQARQAVAIAGSHSTQRHLGRVQREAEKCRHPRCQTHSKEQEQEHLPCLGSPALAAH